MTKTLVSVLMVALLGLVVPAATTPASAESPGGSAPYDVKPFRPKPSDDDRLERAWARWKERGVRRYATVVTQSCFCPPQRAIVTEVSRGTVTSVHRKDRDRQLRRQGYEMPRLYRLLRRAYAEADEVQVRYRAGVPRQVSIDWDEMVSDEETYLSVRLRRR